MGRFFLIAAGLAALFAGVLPAAGQRAVILADSSRTLSERMQQARTAAERKSPRAGYWAGYSIERLMEEHSYIGSQYSDPQRNRPTLGEVISGLAEEESMRQAERHFQDADGHRKVHKEVGILVHYRGQEAPDDIVVSNLSLHVDLQGEPLFWLGGARQEESLAWLTAAFDAARSTDIRESIITAIGLHEPDQNLVHLLGGVLSGNAEADLRGKAAFWLGQADRAEAQTLLMKAARGDRSSDVHEQVVFALSQMHGEGALDSLIALARREPDSEVRKKAVFWLGQKASRKATEAIGGIIENGEDTEVQKSALYALSQRTGSDELDMLIRVANHHRNPELRKTAIYLLGESGDPKALEALVDLVKR